MTLSVADRLSLSDLVHRYAAYVDARRFDDVVELFTGTARLELPQPPQHLGPTIHHECPDGVHTAMAALTETARTHHGIVGEIYTATSKTAATGAITGVAHHWLNDDGRITDVVWYLRYADEYRRTDEGWRIAVRALTIDAIETRPARHVRP